MTPSGATHTIAADDAVELAAAALVRVGAEREIAELQAQHLVEAELRGQPSHGLRRLPVLLKRVTGGLLEPNARPLLRWSADAALVVDGRRGFGPVAAYTAIDALVERSATTGIAAAALHRTHHLGMLAPYVERLAENGCIGLVLTTTEGLVHPWGGSGALIGTNPLAVGIPSSGEGITLDMSTGIVSAGKILDFFERGRDIPFGWAIDANGAPTRDAGAAVNGAISPFGGARGYALGLSLGALVGVLTGTAYGREVQGTLSAEHETTKGDVIVAIRVAAFGQPARSAQLEEYLEQIRASGVDGVPVRIPGDRSRRSRAEAVRNGFQITEQVDRILTADLPEREH